jgi:hypothetical protein
MHKLLAPLALDDEQHIDLSQALQRPIKIWRQLKKVMA